MVNVVYPPRVSQPYPPTYYPGVENREEAVAFEIGSVVGSRVRVSSLVFVSRSMPNKALEPTPTSVTPRAIAPTSEMNHQTENRLQARVVPAAGVAHL